MFGLAAPNDFMNAILAAEKTETRGQDLARLGMKDQGQSFEDVLTAIDSKYLRPDRGILTAMDANRDADEERRTGRKSTGSFDSIISAQVAGALGGIYQDPSMRPDMTAANPFSASATFSQFSPRLSKKAMQVAAANGFPVEAVFGQGAMTNTSGYGTKASTATTGLGGYLPGNLSGISAGLGSGTNGILQMITQLYSSTAATADKKTTRTSSGPVTAPTAGPSTSVNEMLEARKRIVSSSRIARGL